MLPRLLSADLMQALQTMPAVALLGPRQVGKTTLALEVAHSALNKPTHYLDLELDSDLAKLADTEAFLRRYDNQLLIIDEVQRRPDLFRILRGLIDSRKRTGEKNAHFLLLGSASRDLLQQSSESLAGRIRYLELTPFTVAECHAIDPQGFNADKLWFRGGFPQSYLADSDRESYQWRTDFIATYVERDIPQMGIQIPATRMKRFWAMLSHLHGQQVNFSVLAKSLEVSHTTVRNYLDTLTDLYMVRQLQPWSGNTSRRLVKSPKIYLRDTGLLHQLQRITTFDDLLSHPVLGHSWEGFVIESIIATLPSEWQYSYYRSADQTEIDLILERPPHDVLAIEIKRTSAPKLGAGFHNAAQDIRATKKVVVYAGPDRFPLPHDTEAISLTDFLSDLHKPKGASAKSRRR